MWQVTDERNQSSGFKLPIVYNDQVYHSPMTFGVEEVRFARPDVLVKQVDDKLYYGEAWQDQVVF